MEALSTTITVTPLRFRAAVAAAAADLVEAAANKAAADKPPTRPMADDEIRAELERGVPPADVLADMCERGERSEAALARLDTIRGVGCVPTNLAPRPRVDIDDIFADIPDAAILARLASLDLNCEPSVMVPAMLAVASAALCGQVDVVIPPEVKQEDGSDFITALNTLRAQNPFHAPLTTYLLLGGETGLRKSEVPGWAGSDVLFRYQDELNRAWATQPGEAKIDPPKIVHGRATPVALEISILEHGAATIIADEGEDCLRGFLSGAEGKDQAGLLLTAKSGKFWSRSVAGDRTAKKAIVTHTNCPRANLIALVQDCFLEATNEDDRKLNERLYRRGLFARMDIAEMVKIDEAGEAAVEVGLRDAYQRDSRALATAKSRWRERLRGLLPPVRPDGDRHPIAMSLGSIKASLTVDAAAVIHKIDREARAASTAVDDFMRRAHTNVALKAALLALLRTGRLQNVTVTLADVQRAERFVMGYLLPIYAKVRRQAASTIIETDGDQVYAKICVLAARTGGSTTEALVLGSLGRVGWGPKDARNKGVTRLEDALQGLERQNRIERRKVGKAKRIFPIAKGA